MDTTEFYDVEQYIQEIKDALISLETAIDCTNKMYNFQKPCDRCAYFLNRKEDQNKK